MSQIFFIKMSGAGNDFILFDRKINPDIELSPKIIAKLCHRRTGIGADGIILISDSSDHPFEMVYYNADGSTGSLCGNGARCAIYYAGESGRIGDGKIKFVSNGLEYSGQILEKGLIKFYLKHPRKMKQNFKIKAAGQLIPASFADTGSPHVVIKVNDVLRNAADPDSFYTDLNDFPVFDLGREIRHHKDFAPMGTNVNFIQLDNCKIKIRTYERGVEDETLACGTGSVASALISFVKDNLNPPIIIHPRSGDELIVDFKIENQKVWDISLTGPAQITFKGEFSI
ncbi:MAG: diaminopimelate epimerase [Desulfobacterales bacterium]|nr:diaminopimelate epimerase [Desulfobacterales bacterium]